MKILIAGGSGFLGNALTQVLLTQNHEVVWLSSDPKKINTPLLPNVLCLSYSALSTLDNVNVVINLAGAAIADKPWSNKRKQLLADSRIGTTEKLVSWVQMLNSHNKALPHTFISGSAIGWYGAQGSKLLTEDSSAKPEYQHELCNQWEQSALKMPSQVRTIIIRTGVVLDFSGGMLAKLKTPFSLGLGGKLGSGKQMLSWISLHDWVNAVLFLLNHAEHDGIFNLTAPYPITNSEFTKLLASHLKRSAFMHVPSIVLKTTLGEMSTLLLNGQAVYPQNLLDHGFNFQHTYLADFFSSVAVSK